MRQTKLFDEALQTLRLFQRVEVFTLDVLYQGHGGRGLVGHITYQHRHLAQTCQFGGAEPSLTSDDFVFTCVGTCS